MKVFRGDIYQVNDVNVVSYAGSIGGGIIRSKDCQLLPSADCNLQRKYFMYHLTCRLAVVEDMRSYHATSS